MSGLFLIISRKKAAGRQVLGYLVLENGIYAFGVALVRQQPDACPSWGYCWIYSWRFCNGHRDVSTSIANSTISIRPTVEVEELML